MSFCHGDQLTCARIRQLKEQRLRDLTWKERYQHVEPVLGLFHMEMVTGTNILKNHHGPAHRPCPESLWTHNTILKRKPINLEKSQLHKPTLELISHSLYARILDCFTVVCGSSLELWAKKEPKFSDLWQLASIVQKEYASSATIYASRQKPAEEQDRVLENSAMFIRDALLYIELCDAIKCGDSGRVNNVRRFLMFSFWGAGSHNYGLECLYWEQNLRYEWSEALSQAFLDNILLNVRGKRFSWVPADLVQEHLNFWIKVHHFPGSLVRG
jgi:hypothetical protein